MKLFNRMLLVGALVGAGSVVVPAAPVVAQEQAATDRVSIEQVTEMISALGIQGQRKGNRCDFAFNAQMQDQEWALSMSVALSEDGQSVWLIAWLDELPKASNDVPRGALLRLLAKNDQLGEGKFFAYIPGNRRFVMQRSIPNTGLSSARLRLLLQDLGTSVVDTYPIWAVVNWSPTGIPAAPVANPGTPSTTGAPVQTGVNDSKFEQPVRR